MIQKHWGNFLGTLKKQGFFLGRQKFWSWDFLGYKIWTSVGHLGVAYSNRISPFTRIWWYPDSLQLLQWTTEIFTPFFYYYWHLINKIASLVLVEPRIVGDGVIGLPCHFNCLEFDSSIRQRENLENVDPLFNIQLNPDNWNCQGKLKLLRVIGVSSYKGFEQKDQKHLIKVGFVLIHVLLQDF